MAMVAPGLAVVMAAEAIPTPAVTKRPHRQSHKNRYYYQTKITQASLSFVMKGQTKIVIDIDLLGAAKAR